MDRTSAHSNGTPEGASREDRTGPGAVPSGASPDQARPSRARSSRGRPGRRSSVLSVVTSCLLHGTLLVGLWFSGAFEVVATEARPRETASEESAIRIRFVPRWTPPPVETVPEDPTERSLPELSPPSDPAPRPPRTLGAAPGPAPTAESRPDLIATIIANPARAEAAGGPSQRGLAPPVIATPTPLLPPSRPAADSVVSRSAPTRLDRVEPVYPRRCIERRHEGFVDLVVTIDVEGRVTAARVTGRSGCSDLDAAAREAALRLRYEPARENGRPVEGEAPLRVRFVLEDPS